MSAIRKVKRRPSVEQLKAAKEAFAKFDKDGSGQIDGSEFAAALKAANINLSDDLVGQLYVNIDVDGSGKIEFSEFLDWYPSFVETMVNPPRNLAKPGNVVDWASIRAKLPTEKTDAAKAKRMEMFSQFDPNGNGYLSLAEVDKGCRDVLQLDVIFDAKPVIMRAFQAARSTNDAKNKPSSHGPDYIEKCEFRLLLVYLKVYLELWQVFNLIDTAQDRRVDYEEFVMAWPKLMSWGMKGEPGRVFQDMDKNGGGQVLFDEFAAYCISKKLEHEDDDS